MSIKVKVTSGNEINVPKIISDEIELFASKKPKANIVFKLSIPSAENSCKELHAAVLASQKLTREERRERLAEAPKQPTAKFVVVRVFSRNPDVIAEKLEQANGICEDCKCKGPFIRKDSKNQDLYLEVHHEIPLGEGGPDTLNNVRALCPNCHRKIHYGQ